MKLSFQNARVLAVVAHPDDAELLCAGTLARARADGAEIGIITMCRGDKGQPANSIPNLTQVRRKEAQAAARLLGAELLLFGSPDGELSDGISERKKLTELFRQFRPTLVLAHSLGDYHPDHRAAGVLAEAASWFCASKGYRTRSPALQNSPALWWMDTLNMGGSQPGFFLDVSEFLQTKLDMLACHKSQIARGTDPDFAPLARLMDQQARTRGSQAGVAAAEAFQICTNFKRTAAF
jgi:LmbE family N-acetylglucosaminyl deacetylase